MGDYTHTVWPPQVLRRLQVYMRVCDLLLEELPALREADTIRPRLRSDDVLKLFNQELKNFMKDDYEDVGTAAATLGGILHLKGQSFRSTNGTAADILSQVGERLRQTCEWEHRAQMDRFHQQGQALARAFYKTPLGSSRPRDVQPYQLRAQYDMEKQWPDQTPMSCGSKGTVIDYWFTKGDDFDRYLCNLGFFVHEYTAHIYRFDEGANRRFTDGWMFFAAATFLFDVGVNYPEEFGLCHDQGTIALDVFLDLVKNDRDLMFSYSAAREVDAWLGSEQFLRITRELAFLDPPPDDPTWVTEFTDLLKATSFQTGPNRAMIRALIHGGSGIQDLDLILRRVLKRELPPHLARRITTR